MNKDISNLLRKYPQLNKRKIWKLLKEHHFTINTTMSDESRDMTDLEYILSHGNVDNIIELFIKNQKYIDIDKHTPKSMLSNPKLAQYIIKENPLYIEYFDDDLITPEIIQLFQSKIEEENDNNIITKYHIKAIPGKCFNSDHICEFCLEKVFYSDVYSNLLLKIMDYYPSYLNKAIEYGIEKKFKINLLGIPDNTLYTLLKTDKALEIIDNRDIDFSLIRRIYNYDRNLAIKIFKESLDLGIYKKGNPHQNEIINDQDIFNIIIDYNLTFYFDESFDNVNLSFFTSEIIKKLSYSNQENVIPDKFFDKLECLLLLVANNLPYISENILRKFSFEVFNEYFDSLDDISKCNAIIKNVVISKIISENIDKGIKSDHAQFLKIFLDELNSKDLNVNELDYIERVISSFSCKALTNEILDQLIEIQKKYHGVLTYLCPDVYFDQRIFDYLLENCNDRIIQYLLAFNVKVFNDNNVDIVLNKITSPYKLNELSNSLCNSVWFLKKLFENKKNDKNILNQTVLSKFNFSNQEIMDFMIENINIKMLLVAIKKNPDINDISLGNLNVKLCEEKLEELYYSASTDNMDIAFCLWFIREIQKLKITSDKIEENKEKLLRAINTTMLYNQKAVNDYIFKVINGNKNPFNYRFISSEKKLKFVTYIAEISSDVQAEFVDCIPEAIIDKINVKHLNNIIKLLEQLNVEKDSIIKLAINIYMVLGYEIAVEFLSTNPQKNYGIVNENILNYMFSNINLYDILLEQKGNGYVPVLNEKLLNIIFGKNNKIKNTPIRNFLNGFADKQEEINNLKERIKNDLRLTSEEKETKIHECDEQLNKYMSTISEFFSYLGRCFGEWDIVEEEFLKKKFRNKLELKLNVSTILDILKNIKSIRCELDDVRDEKLIHSDVFDYVGIDNQYTANPEKAPLRAVTLSRKMEGLCTKKFPNISITEGKYTIRVYHPQDRRILSAGYRSSCCFRPNGNADNSGADNSLLHYCATTEYGGGVEIVDSEGNTFMFSPLLRNGNVLMIHSFETSKSSVPKECYTLLKQFSEKVIEESHKASDNIDFVLMTALHNLDTSITEGSLPPDKEFIVYDAEGKYSEMYNNLSCSHMILAHNPNKKVQDIVYGEVSHTYQFETSSSYNQFDINDETIELCDELFKLKSEITSMSNLRDEKMKNGEEKESYQLLESIKIKKQEYRALYQKILEANKGEDIFKEANSVINNLSKMSKTLSITDLKAYGRIIYGSDWFIAVTKNNTIEYGCLESGKEMLETQLKNLKAITDLVVDNDEEMKLN